MPKAQFKYSQKDEQKLFNELQSPEIADDPLAFCRYVWPWGQKGTPLENVPDLRAWQIETLNEIKEHIKEQKRRAIHKEPPKPLYLARCAGRGIGKSAIEVMLAYWMLSTRIGSTVMVSANNDDQLQKVTWGELAGWHSMAINSHWFDLQATTLTPAAWLKESIGKAPAYHDRNGPYYQMVQKLWSKENPNAYAGPHNRHGMMILFDEAAGIPESIWTVASGFLTDLTMDRYWFAFSNGRSNEGAFYNCFEGEDRDNWNTKNINALDVKEIDHGVHNRIIARWGVDSDEARVEVYGQFPKQGDDQFINPTSIEAAAKRELSKDPWAPLIMGVDTARAGGAKSVIRWRQGRDARSIPPRKFKGLTNPQLVAQIAKAIDETQPDAVCIDSGNTGGAVIDDLRALKYKVHEVKFGGVVENNRWADKRTEMWAEIREWLDAGGCIDDDRELKTDLAGPHFKFTGPGMDKVKLESKEEMRERKKASPDDGDALACTFAVRVPRRDSRTRRGGGRNSNVAKDVDYAII